jgi:hypothetical protein
MKHSVKTDKFALDLRVLDNLANAYHNCENGEFRSVWKNKWYEHLTNISKRIQLESEAEASPSVDND